MSRRGKSDGFLRLTKVGLWFLIFLAVVVVAATNTGNNGLFLVLAVMVGALAISHLLAAGNVRGLALAAAASGEVFANRPAGLAVEVTNRGWLPRWLLVLTVDPQDIEPAGGGQRRSSPFLVPYLDRREAVRENVELTLLRRGRRHIRRLHVTSLFPLGFFRRGRRYPVDAEVLVYPQILEESSDAPEQLAQAGQQPTRRAGWGHELFGLRTYRHGDDPRSIHWKQSARTGALIFKERETEENRNLLIVLDNAVGDLDEEGAGLFERLVSQAATAALDYLERGYEVALQTREGILAHAAGPRQRHAILETLALIEPHEKTAVPIPVPGGVAHLRLAMESEPALGMTA